jgi:ubiquinol-cytochrome c reductase cytochrome b subunit
VWLGWLLRGMHYYGASAMVVLITLHMLRVFLTGSYKFPREMNWLLGVVLLLLTVLMAATGQLLRWDQNGIWTVTVGSQLFARVPLIGEPLAQFVLAGDRVGGATLSRFFAFHVLILPGLILLDGRAAPLPGAAPRRLGAAARREAGGPRDLPRMVRARAEAQPLHLLAARRLARDRRGAAGGRGVMLLAWLFGPKGPGDPPDPTTIAADPRPDWYFRWYYALLAVKPRGLETFFMVYLPLLIVLALVALPIVRNTGRAEPERRPWAMWRRCCWRRWRSASSPTWGCARRGRCSSRPSRSPRRWSASAEGPVWHGRAALPRARLPVLPRGRRATAAATART